MRSIPSWPRCARKGDGPLLSFGLFDGYEVAGPGDAACRRRTAPMPARPRPRIAQADYEKAALEVREHLFAGDFYQANLTFGCDVAVAGDPLALYARLRRSAMAGWGGVLIDEDRAPSSRCRPSSSSRSATASSRLGR